MKTLKSVLQGLCFLVLLLVFFAVAIISTLDISKYKEAIERETSLLLQHEVRIKGELSWRWWPYFGIYADDIVVYGKNRRPQVNIQAIKAHLVYQPLINGNLSIDRLDIIHSVINLPWSDGNDDLKNEVFDKQTQRKRNRIQKLVTLKAINFKDIYFKEPGQTLHFDKIQAINISADKPFPLFVAIHLNQTPTYRQRKYERVSRIYDGKIKGMASLPKDLFSLPLAERIFKVRFDGELLADRVRFLGAFGENVKANLTYRAGKLKVDDVRFNAGQGIVNASLECDIIEGVSQGKVKARRVETTRLHSPFPLRIQGLLDIDAEFKAIIKSLDGVLNSMKGHAQFSYSNGTFSYFDTKLAISSAVKLSNNYKSNSKRDFSLYLTKLDHDNLITNKTLAFESAVGDVSFSPNEVTIEQFQIISYPFTLNLQAKLNMKTSSVSGKGLLEIDTDELADFPTEIQELHGKIPLTIIGGRKAPLMTLDPSKIIPMLYHDPLP